MTETKRRLLELVYEHDELAELDPGARRLALRALIGGALDGEGVRWVGEVADAIDGFGPITAVMQDDDVTDVLVNGPSEIWVERGGRLVLTELAFADSRELEAMIARLVGDAGGRLDTGSPVATVRLADGARLHAVLAPCAPGGPLVSIRRFPPRPIDVEGLVTRRMMTVPEAERLVSLVSTGASLLIAGGTGTGKTTLLNALLAHVPADQRVITIEETSELRPTCAHVVSLVARAANLEGRGAVTLDDLVRSALRMRPDRIVVGEVRGAEALAAIEALSSGHGGSMVTLHARSAREALDRMVGLALAARTRASADSLEKRVRRAFGAVAVLVREGGERRVAALEEIV
jgi:pilus assembly protein CpaF